MFIANIKIKKIWYNYAKKRWEMKLHVKCKSILLQKSLSLFLKPYLTSSKHCDFFISDQYFESEKPLFLIGKDIKKPFNKNELLNSINKFATKINVQQKNQKPKKSEKSFIKQNKELNKQIETLTSKFSQDLVKLIKNYYEK